LNAKGELGKNWDPLGKAYLHRNLEILRGAASKGEKGAGNKMGLSKGGHHILKRGAKTGERNQQKRRGKW